MPRPMWIDTSAVVRWASFETTTWASIAVLKYFSSMELRLVSIWSRKASPISICLPVVVSCMGFDHPFPPGLGCRREPPRANVGTRPRPVKRSRQATLVLAHTVSWSFPMRVASQREQLIPAALHRRGDAHRIAVFCDRATGDVDTGLLQQFDDTLVREGAVRWFSVDQAADAMAHRFGRVRPVSVRGWDRRREEIFEFVETPRRGHVFVAGDPAHRALVHADRIRDVAQNQRSQRLHAVTKKSVLLTNNFSGDFEDSGGPLVQRLDQPIRGV